MDASRKSSSPATDVLIRRLHVDELAVADDVRRLAFGTFLGLPDPMRFRGDASPVRTRFLADPDGSFAAELDGELVGTNFVIAWGSVGFFGPLSVRPDVWERGIAQRLVETVLAELARRSVRHIGLFTFGHSPKHVALYQKFGFWPRFPTVIMAKPVRPTGAVVGWTAVSDLSRGQLPVCLDACRRLTGSIFPGLDLTGEIETVAKHNLGDTLILGQQDAPDGIAVCHIGAGTEAGSGHCYVKFAAARPGPDAESTFARLLAACEALAAKHRLTQLVAGTNTARRAAYRQMLAFGFRTDVLGLAMDRPDEATYSRSDALVIDDWR